MSNLKEEACQYRTKMRSEREQFTAQLEILSTCVNQTLISDPERALEVAELEAFDKWMTQETPTKEHISAQQLFDRIVTKLGHMIKTPKNELHQTRSGKQKKGTARKAGTKGRIRSE